MGTAGGGCTVYRLSYVTVILILLLYLNYTNSIPTIVGSNESTAMIAEGSPIIGFGGHNPDEKITADMDGKIIGIGEMSNKLQSNSADGLKILVTLENISNLVQYDRFQNYSLTVEHINSIYPESEYLEYFLDVSKLDENNINRTTTETPIFFLFYPGLIRDGQQFDVCVNSYHEYRERITCSKGINHHSTMKESIDLAIPKVINIQEILASAADYENSTRNDDGNEKYNKNSFGYPIEIRQINTLATNDSLNLGSVEYDDQMIIKFDPLSSKIHVIKDYGSDIYLNEIEASNIQNLTDERISGNYKVRINGFTHDNQTSRIYAIGKYYYWIGNDYEKEYGIAQEYNDHSLFVIDPNSGGRIEKRIVLWSGEEEGDETSTGKQVFLHENNSELYIPEIDEGELASVFVVDPKRNNNQIRSNLDFYKEFGLNPYAESLTYDSKEDIFFICTTFDRIYGIDITNERIIKNYSSSYCPETVSIDSRKGYGLIDGRLGIIRLDSGVTSTIIKGGNISSLYLKGGLNAVYALGYSTDEAGYGDGSDIENVTSYIYKINGKTDKIDSIYIFSNTYIVEIVGAGNSEKHDKEILYFTARRPLYNDIYDLDLYEFEILKLPN